MIAQRANILKGMSIVTLVCGIINDSFHPTEVQIMRGTSHPSIVKLLSFSESPDHFFLVLERMCATMVIRIGGC